MVLQHASRVQRQGWGGESCWREAQGSTARQVMRRHVMKDLGNQAIFRLDIIRSFCLGKRARTSKGSEQSHCPAALLLAPGNFLKESRVLIVFASSLLPFVPQPRAIWKCSKYPHAILLSLLSSWSPEATGWPSPTSFSQSLSP